MQIPQIRVEQTNALIGLRSTKSVQEIKQTPADLTIKQIPAKLTINRIQSQLDIDQEEAWNQRNLKTPQVFSRDMAELSKQEGLEGIAEIAEEGNRLAAIENKVDAIVAKATDVALPMPKDYNITFIPNYGSVKFNYRPTELQMNWEIGKAEINTTQHRPEHTYIPKKIEVYLRQMNQIQINFVGLNVNKSK